MHSGGRTDPPRNGNNMLMMGEINHLANGGHIGKEPDRLFGAKIIEGLHDVVGNEGHGRAHTREFMITRHAKR